MRRRGGRPAGAASESPTSTASGRSHRRATPASVISAAWRWPAAGAEVVLAVRDLDRGAGGRAADPGATSMRPRLRVVHLDLADLASVPTSLPSSPRPGRSICLVNNAGLMLVPRRELTGDGFEMHMGVNHLGHFALTAGLLPALERAPAGRVVSVTSIAARRARRSTTGSGLAGDYTPMGAYSQSKLAVGAVRAKNWTGGCGRPDRTVTSVLAHPGWSATAVDRPDERGRPVRAAVPPGDRGPGQPALGRSPIGGRRGHLSGAAGRGGGRAAVPGAGGARPRIRRRGR